MKMGRRSNALRGVSFLAIFSVGIFTSCATTDGVYHDQNMDFAAVQSVAVMPFVNLTGDRMAGERVRDVFMTMLLSTSGIYVLPPGEVARGVSKAGIANPAAPSPDEIKILPSVIKADAVITGVVREYGEVRSGTTSSNVISVSLQMIETKTGKIVWTASSTKGGISAWDRLFGGGGKPLNDVTEDAINELIDKLFK